MSCHCISLSVRIYFAWRQACWQKYNSSSQTEVQKWQHTWNAVEAQLRHQSSGVSINICGKSEKLTMKGICFHDMSQCHRLTIPILMQLFEPLVKYQVLTKNNSFHTTPWRKQSGFRQGKILTEVLLSLRKFAIFWIFGLLMISPCFQKWFPES